MSVIDIYDVEDVSEDCLDSIKDSLKKFKLYNPFVRCVSCIEYMKSSKSTIEMDLNNYTFDSLYHEAHNDATREAIKHVITKVLHVFLDNDTDSEFGFDSWINMVCYEQEYIYNNKFHDHHSMNIGNVIPDKSLVFYIQMPNNLHDNDGVLYYKENTKVKYILPKKGQLFVMDSRLTHVPNNAPHTTRDRIALGVNIKLL
jgi:hypothetical protein